MENKRFKIDINPETGRIRAIVLQNDRYHMNWCGQTHEWGEIFFRNEPHAYDASKNMGMVIQTWNFQSENKLVSFEQTDERAVSVYSNGRLQTTVTRTFAENGDVVETYEFQNISPDELFFRKGEVGIYTPFADEYRSASESLTTKCSAHVWCGEHVSWVNALRQGDLTENVGLVLTDGSIEAYSIDRDNQTVATADRGSIVLHPFLAPLLPGEKTVVVWRLFEHMGNDDFLGKIRSLGGLYTLQTGDLTAIDEQSLTLSVAAADDLVIRLNGRAISYAVRDGVATVRVKPEEVGDYRFELFSGGRQTHALMYYAGDFDELLKKRLEYIADFQQYHRKGSRLDGAYLIYDIKDHRPYFNNKNADHNASRERLGMGITMARYLRSHKNEKLKKSLEEYAAFVLREFIDIENGTVFDTIGKDPKVVRLYNAPWGMMFLAELYNLTAQDEYIEGLHRIVEYYYSLGSERFYPDGIGLKFILDTFAKAGRTDYYESARLHFEKHVQKMIDTGLNYPPHEVVYEQTIVTPAVVFISEMGLVKNDPAYAEKVKEHVKTLDRFNGMQPDYHLNGISIRYWDDFWFGKSALFTDTLPHYWSCLTAHAHDDYYRLSGEEAYRKAAENGIKNCLCLFLADGSASCAYNYPFSTDGKPGECFDEWANDQDFALYFAMKILRSDWKD